MLRWFFGAGMFTTNHRPFARLPRLNPLLQRELRSTDAPSTVQDNLALPLFDRTLFRAAFIVYAVGLCWLCGGSVSDVPQALSLGIFSAFTVISVGVDLYAAIRIVNVFHHYRLSETWDTLRLAMHDDLELIRSFAAIGVVQGWRGLQVDIVLRTAPTVIGVFSGVGMVWAAVISLVNRFDTQPSWLLIGEDALVLLTGLLVIRLGVVFISDPPLRFELMVSLAIFCATRFRDTLTALVASVVSIVAVRLVHGLAILWVYNLTISILAGLYPWQRLAEDNQPAAVVWMLTLIITVVPFTKNLYVVLRNRLEHLTLSVMGNGE